MIEALFNQPNYVAAKKMMDVTVLRMEAVAANMANLETPGYRRVDVPKTFEERLQQEIQGGDARGIGGLKPELRVDKGAAVVRPDGNTVDMESEMILMHQASTEHALETRLVTGNLLKMRLAITGRPS
ncbi:MAG: hypothetical protein RI897_2790 [Verrucomicrobiota bacterium]|jgi:flagellar basal-body rod protein FlgB